MIDYNDPQTDHCTQEVDEDLMREHDGEVEACRLEDIRDEMREDGIAAYDQHCDINIRELIN